MQCTTAFSPQFFIAKGIKTLKKYLKEKMKYVQETELDKTDEKKIHIASLP